MTQTPAITLDWVREEKAKLKARLSDLEATERVMLSAPAGPAETVLSAVKRHGLEAVVTAAAQVHGSKKRTLLQAIADSVDGLPTQAVIAAGTAAGLKDLKTDNTSPQLSGARADGLLSLEDGVWKITAKGRAYLAEPKN